LALKTEEEGYQLYRTATKQAKQNFTRSVFDQLAKDELLHKDLINRFYTHLKTTNEWKSLSANDTDYQSSKKKMKTIFSDALSEAKENQLDFTDDEVNAYRKAVEFEKNGVEMYNDLYKKSTDQFAQKFYGFLREMEQEHYELLERTLSYINQSDNYYLLEEGWTLDD
jgi:rubrerythrin